MRDCVMVQATHYVIGDIYANVFCYIILYCVAEAALNCHKMSFASLGEELHIVSQDRYEREVKYDGYTYGLLPVYVS